MDGQKDQNAAPYNLLEFPTLSQYPEEQVEEAVQSLMKQRSMTRQQALLRLEMENER